MKQPSKYNVVWAFAITAVSIHSEAYSDVIHLPVVTVSAVEHFSPTESTMFPGVFGMYDNVNFGFAETDGLASVGLFTGSWITGDTVIVRVEAQSGFEFRISPHPDASVTSFYSYTSFLVDGGSSIGSDASVRFENLQGPIPTIDALSGSVGTIGQWIGAGFNYHVASPFSFTAFEIEFTTAGPGEITADRAYRNFVMEVGTGARNPLADVQLLEIVPIPEPSCYSLLAVGLIIVPNRLLRK